MYTEEDLINDIEKSHSAFKWELIHGQYIRCKTEVDGQSFSFCPVTFASFFNLEIGTDSFVLFGNPMNNVVKFRPIGMSVDLALKIKNSSDSKCSIGYDPLREKILIASKLKVKS